MKDDYVVCPSCGAKLCPTCPNCQTPVEPSWIVCPKCAEPLPQQQEGISSPARPKDRTLWKILVCLIVIPLILVVLMYLFIGLNFSAGSVSCQEVSVQEYFDTLESTEALAEVMQWLDETDLRSDQAYALRYTKDTGNSTGHYLLVRVPGASNSSTQSFDQRTGLFGTKIKLNLARTGSNDTLFCISSSSDRVPKMDIHLDGKKLPCQITDVDYNPTTYMITPEYDITAAPEGSIEVYVEQITEEPEMKPVEMTVSKYIGSQEVGIFEYADQDQIKEQLAMFEPFDFLLETPELFQNYVLNDFYKITVHYSDTTGPTHHEEFINYFAIEENGEYYLIQSSGKFLPEADGTSIQSLDIAEYFVMHATEEFYASLSTQFD